MIELIGWFSTGCFTVAGFPQVVKTVREGHADGVSTGFLIFWFLGNLLGSIYAFLAGSYPLAIGFTTSVFFGSIIWRYKLWRRHAARKAN